MPRLYDILMKYMPLPSRRFILLLGLFVGCCLAGSPLAGFTPSNAADLPPINKRLIQHSDYQAYLGFFEEVYAKVQQNYYHTVDPKDFMKFIYLFNTKIYGQLKRAGKSQKYIKWRSAAFLVDALKAEEDIFSQFFPPRDADRFEKEVLGKRIDLGIEGALTSEGYVVLWVEPRSDAYEKGLREKDILLGINASSVSELSQEAIQDLLKPLEGEVVTLAYWDKSRERELSMDVISKEYFKQAAFKVPVDEPNIFCIRIERFNRATGEDVTRLMQEVLSRSDSRLIIDLRNNPGGPPLAALELSAFFLEPNDEFAYFQKKNRPKAQLMIPAINQEYRFSGPIAILINEKSGSSAELFSGVMQRRGRATLIGSNTAGQVFLKSMFYFSDGSMVLLVTARGHHPDGHVFSFDGVTPDIDKSADDLIRVAAQYLKKQKISVEQQAALN